MALSPRFFRWHRWLAWLVALQVLAWLAGSFVFTWLPFTPWVKAEDSVSQPNQPLPPDWAAAVARHLQHHATARRAAGLAAACKPPRTGACSCRPRVGPDATA